MKNLTARLAAKAALLTLTAGLSLGFLGTAAHASTLGGFDANCNGNRSVTASAMDLHAYPGYSARWAPHLFRWTTAGWQSYAWGPTMVQRSSDWMVGDYTFPNLPPGYYQVRDSMVWAYNGVDYATQSGFVGKHWDNAPVYSLTSRYPTSSYCYEG